MEALPVGIVGADRYADLLVELLGKSDRFNLVAICDQRGEVRRRYEVEGRTWDLFDDPREMILRSGIAMLIVWRGSGQETFLELAIEKQIWLVLRTAGEAPLASSGKLVPPAGKDSPGVFAWCPWLFVPSFMSIQDWLADQQIHSMHVRFAVSDKNLDCPSLDNPLRALTSPSVFLAQQWLGVPQAVFCYERLGSRPDSEKSIQYDCTLNLIYDAAVATVSASLNAGPDRHAMYLHGSGGTMEAEVTQAHWYDLAGKLISSSALYTADQARRTAYDQSLSAIWQAYQERQRNTPFELKRYLAVMATLEAGALSTRTGHAEQLAKVAELGDIVAL